MVVKTCFIIMFIINLRVKHFKIYFLTHFLHEKKMFILIIDCFLALNVISFEFINL